jgi:hypothetical protein
MKTIRLSLLLFVFSATCFAPACSNSEPKKEKTVDVQYQCPMKCTDEVFSKPGTCPVCGMELEKIANS